jgi:chemotaxis response regulator CheB/chemotaxis methyl-accepting protein methylase
MEKFSEEERETVHRLAAGLTSTCQSGRFRHELVMNNLRRRMDATQHGDLKSYLNYAYSDEEEFWHLISALTIHTTAWFREAPHFERLEKHLAAGAAKLNDKVRILSAACSTGEEVYSFGVVLEAFRRSLPGFEYEIIGIDIDPISIQTAMRALYNLESLDQIPQKYRRFFLAGSGKSAGLMTVCREVRQRCQFSIQNLLELEFDFDHRFNAIVCRNVLIYFSAQDVAKIIAGYLDILKPNGLLCLGHSEALDARKHKLRNLGNAIYTPDSRIQVLRAKTKPIRVLVIDDSPTIVKAITKAVDPDRIQIASAQSAQQASDYLKTNSVDLITLDLYMPGVSGPEWLRSERAQGLRTPVIVFSGASHDEAQEVLGVLETGAQDFIDKSMLRSNPASVIERFFAIAGGFRDRKGAVVTSNQKLLDVPCPDLILIGASTGGTQVLAQILQNLGEDVPPILVTQHISAAFARTFAERLAAVGKLTLCNPTLKPELRPGCLYMALADYHIGVQRQGKKLLCQPIESAPVNRHRPSVDVLFRSAAEIPGIKCCAALLTGMGVDGASGLLKLRQAGATTLAQDEASSIVFGMPKEAIAIGAAQFIGNPYLIRQQLMVAIHGRVNTCEKAKHCSPIPSLP